MPAAAPGWQLHTLPYKQVGELSLSVDVYTPKAAQPGSEAQPVVAWFHGGCLIFGDRATFAPHWLLQALVAQRGWTLLSFDYRLLPNSGLDDILDDLSDAGSFIQQRLNSSLTQLHLSPADVSRVVAAGASAGGYLSLQAGVLWRGPRPRCVLDLYGMSMASTSWYGEPQPDALPQARLLPDKVDAAASLQLLSQQAAPISGFSIEGDWSDPQRLPRFALYRVLIQQGKYWQLFTGLQQPAAAPLPAAKQRLLPLTQIDAAFPPTLVLHGTADGTVPHEDSDRAVEALQAAGVQVQYHRVEGKPHGFDAMPDPALAPLKDSVVQFLLQHTGSSSSSSS